MFTLNNDNVASLHNTGNELTGQCVSDKLQELYIGNGPRAYMPKRDAKELLSEADYKNACTHPDNKNPLFVYLDNTTLERLLEEHEFIVTDEE